MAKREKTPKISPSEAAVMRVIWESSDPLTANEIIERLEERTKWQPKTVRTFLNRLVTKGALSAQKRTFRGIERLHYLPCVTRDAVAAAKSSSLVETLFGGTIRSMLAGFIDSGELSPDDLADLRRRIDEKLGKDE